MFQSVISFYIVVGFVYFAMYGWFVSIASNLGMLACFCSSCS